MQAFFEVSEGTEKLPTPLVFASEEGFDTGNPFVIVSHLDHVLRFINGIAEGRSVENMQTLLENPLDNSTPRRILDKLASMASAENNSLQNKYTPVCNANREEYFNGQYKLYDIEVRPSGVKR
jgi:hypothetical protein